MHLPQLSLESPSWFTTTLSQSSIIHSAINNLDQKMFGKNLGRVHLVQALKKKWFLLEKRRTKEWEMREKFNWVELVKRELKIKQVVGIKRFVKSIKGRVVAIVESIKRERVEGRVIEGWEKGLFGRIQKQSHCCKI
ncbi:hypothetical protein PVK06_011638 [Gossypium arboreum]|uniref:Uncharacterized protein n=1 Tax=Gossypium arboreum TaxID=29729 RepID=A0ABR0Q9H2_GOSAR|nr:hypothetical protein PVK06_011638 [Gossypium arboreum]